MCVFEGDVPSDILIGGCVPPSPSPAFDAHDNRTASTGHLGKLGVIVTMQVSSVWWPFV